MPTLIFNFITAKSFTYQLLNFTGAIGLIIEAASKKDVQPAALNAIWGLVAIVAIVQLAMH